MKRLSVLVLVLSLIINLAAPAGAVFAMDEPLAMELDDTAVVEGTEILLVEMPEVESEDTAEITDLVEPLSIPDQEYVEATELKEVVAPVAHGIVITELQTRGGNGASSELVELFNASQSDTDVTGWCVQYASAAGASYANRSCIVPEGSESGLRVVLPAQSHAVFATDEFVAANEGFRRDARLSGTMADTGGRVRVVDASGGVVDLLGWGSASESEGSPAPAIPASGVLRSLQRVMTEDGYLDTDSNVADFVLAPVKTSYQSGALYEVVDVCSNVAGLQLDVPDGLWRMKSGVCVDKASINFCENVRMNEVAANVARQYIEITNDGEVATSLTGCRIMTNRSQSTYAVLPDAVLEPGEYLVVYVDETPLKLTKSTNGTVYLMASDGETEAESVYYEDMSAETSWSRFADGWKQTFALTPEVVNVYEQYAPCAEGYARNLTTGRCNKVVEATSLTDCGEGRERNPATGRCRNIPTEKELAPCKEGQYRSEETNRCRSIALAASSLKPCADDQFRNPETNRCKKIASADELADCGEGRERNPATNRCRNILASTMPTAGFAPEAVAQTASSMLGWWVAGGVSLLALGYAGWQWRFEIGRLTKRVGGYFTSGSK